MTTDTEEQENELLALDSILGSGEFVRKESKAAGEIRVSAELSAHLTVALREGETLRQYEISFLPPLLLTFELPEDYPSSSPPGFTLTCCWLTHSQLSALAAQLTHLYQETGGTVVLFTWVQFLKEEALGFLGIHTVLELPSDEQITQDHSQDPSHVAPAGVQKNQPSSGCTDDRRSDILDSAPLLFEAESPAETGPDSGPNTEYQKTSDDSNQSSQVSGSREAERASQLESDSQRDLSPAAGKSKPPLVSGEDQTRSALSLTPSQALLSRLLIYSATQKRIQLSSTVFDCGVCFVGWLGADCVQLPECGHIFCRPCLARFCQLQITEGNVRGVTCPQAGCPAAPTPEQVRSLVGNELFSRYDRLLLQNTLDSMPDVVYCPRVTCGVAVIWDKSSTAAMCSVCSFAFCVRCKKTYHGENECPSRMKKLLEKDLSQTYAALPRSQEGLKALWEDYARGSKQRQRFLESRYSRQMLQRSLSDCLSDEWVATNSKLCPHCFSKIEKNGGCNVMTCSRCGQSFCWLCLTRLPASRHSAPCEVDERATAT